MNRPALLLLLPALALPLTAARFPAIPKEVWAMSADPALQAQGAVVLERKLDFQPMYFEETIRIRIVSQAGVAAAEFPDLPAELLFIDGQVTFPDGRVQAIGKREDFLVRDVVSTVDGTARQGVLIAPGVTSDCVLDLRVREWTARGRANQARTALNDAGNLPARCGDFHYWTLASAYPSRTVVLQEGKEVFWRMLILGAGPDVERTTSAAGTQWTFRDLPALPPAPYASNFGRPSPKVVFFKPIDGLSYLEGKATATAFWNKTADFIYKDWFLKYVSKGSDYRAFSEEMRKDLPAGPRAQARVIAERIQRRTVNLDRLLFDEKPGTLARHFVEEDGVSKLNYTARTGFTDDQGIVKLVFHVLTDAGLHPTLALVASRYWWNINPEIRTPYQFSHELLGVAEPGQDTLWLDPVDRMVPPGEVPYPYQGTRAVVMDPAKWETTLQEIKLSTPKANTRTYTYRIEATDEAAAVQVELKATGAPAHAIRDELAQLSPTQREAWFRTRMQQRGLALAKVEALDVLDPTRPLGFTAEGTQPVEAGRLLKLVPFPGMDADLYLPASLPEDRADPIMMPFRRTQKAVSTLQVPKGYLLREPLEDSHANRWGEVALHATQNAATGLVTVEATVVLDACASEADGYGDLKDFLQWVRAATSLELTLEREADRP
jgi:hypothetical protein